MPFKVSLIILNHKFISAETTNLYLLKPQIYICGNQHLYLLEVPLLMYRIRWVDQMFFLEIPDGDNPGVFDRESVMLDFLDLINRENTDVWACSAYSV